MIRKMFALLLALALLCPLALAEEDAQSIKGGYALFTLQKHELEQEIERLNELIEAMEKQLMEGVGFDQPDEPVPGMLATDGANLLTVPGNPELQRVMIVSIEFRADLSDAPDDAWDASACGDGSVMAWAQEAMGGYSLTIAADGPVKAPTNSHCLFANYSFVKQISFADAFDTSGTMYMRNMFENCKRLTEADMSGLDLSSVTDLYSLLDDCPGTPSVNIEIPERVKPKFGGLG